MSGIVTRHKPTERLEQALPRAQRWPRGDATGHDPVERREPALITRRTPVGSMGSCFANEIRRCLLAMGYAYVQTEDGPGVTGSARFGEVYNTACLRQIVESALGRFEPAEPVWRLSDDKLVDPYRKFVTWPDATAAAAERALHRAAVVEAIRRSDVFIVTAGMAEVWRSRIDGAVFYEIPPRAAFDPALHECAMLGVEENVANLERMYAGLHEINPSLRLIVTLSPVPLLATFRRSDCVVANAISKATLRIAIEAFCDAHPEVLYFPSYEIVTSLCDRPFVGGRKDDNRHPGLHHIARVMRLFMDAFGEPGAGGDVPEAWDAV